MRTGDVCRLTCRGVSDAFDLDKKGVFSGMIFEEDDKDGLYLFASKNRYL